MIRLYLPKQIPEDYNFVVWKILQKQYDTYYWKYVYVHTAAHDGIRTLLKTEELFYSWTKRLELSWWAKRTSWLDDEQEGRGHFLQRFYPAL